LPEVTLPGPQQSGRFLRRLNRFAALVEVGGRETVAHLPNSGRMTELLVPGHAVLLVERFGPARKTAFDMVLVAYQGRWVSVDSRLPSELAFVALQQRALLPWADYSEVRREVRYSESRLDLELREGARRCLIEAKSVNLVCDGRALFPDAPTQRGARHLQTLMHAARAGIGAGVVFVIQRDDARSLAPFDAADPQFGRLLREAAHSGVQVHAYRCNVSPRAIALGDEVPVEL